MTCPTSPTSWPTLWQHRAGQDDKVRRKRRVSLRYDRRAAGALDFALVAVPLLLLVFGVIEFGRLMWAREAVQMAATQGARCIGVLHTSCSSGGAYSQANTQTYIINAARAWGITLTSGNLTLTANATSGVCAGMSPQVAQVVISYTFQSVVPGLLDALSGGKALTGRACFPMQPA